MGTNITDISKHNLVSNQVPNFETVKIKSTEKNEDYNLMALSTSQTKQFKADEQSLKSQIYSTTSINNQFIETSQVELATAIKEKIETNIKSTLVTEGINTDMYSKNNLE